MEKTKKLVIVGSGETGLIAYEYFQFDSNYDVDAFSVNEEYITETTINDLPVVPFERLEEKYNPNEYEVYVAISSGKLNRNRTKVYNEAKIKGYKCASYVSSKAFVWRNVEIGENCFIFEDNTLQPFVKLENNITLWSGNHIGHHSIIQDNCFVTSHVVISGGCEIGENTFIGVNATLRDHIKIGKSNVIGAGALILNDTEDNKVFMANPTEASKVPSNRLRGI